MSYLVADFGPFHWLVEKALVYQDEVSGFEECVVFGLSSREGRGLEFNVHLPNGAMYWRVPLARLRTHRSLKQDPPLSPKMKWDCFSETFEVHSYSWLQAAAPIILKSEDKNLATPVLCQYIATIDWTKNTVADQAGEIGHKCAHIINDADGHIYALPNSELRWACSSFGELTHNPPKMMQRAQEFSYEQFYAAKESEKFLYPF